MVLRGFMIEINSSFPKIQLNAPHTQKSPLSAGFRAMLDF